MTTDSFSIKRFTKATFPETLSAKKQATMTDDPQPATDSPPDFHPVHLEKTDDRSLLIRWSDDVEQKTSFRKLRDNCRCANCIDKRMKAINEASSQTPDGKKQLSNALPVLSQAQTMPLNIEKMHPVGNYAYSIHFSDGHSAGIFTFELLRSLID